MGGVYFGCLFFDLTISLYGLLKDIALHPSFEKLGLPPEKVSLQTACRTHLQLYKVIGICHHLFVVRGYHLT